MYNFAIEYDGEQYFSPIDYFGGESYFRTLQQRDVEKNNKCKNNNCKLFRVKFGYNESDYEELVNNIQSYLTDPDNFVPILKDGSKITII